MARYAVVDETNTVRNVIEWDGETALGLAETLVAVPADAAVACGYAYNPSTGAFTSPTPPADDAERLARYLAGYGL